MEKKSHEETLRDVVNETVAAVKRIRNVLGEGEAREAWESFAGGYLTFHAASPRYHLEDLIDSRYMAQ